MYEILKAKFASDSKAEKALKSTKGAFLVVEKKGEKPSDKKEDKNPGKKKDNGKKKNKLGRLLMKIRKGL